jgi:hypothetical protein
MSDIKELRRKASELRRKEINTLCVRVFRSDEGYRLLNLLKEEFILHTPIAIEDCKELYGEHYVGIREGQNDMIRQLHLMANNDLYKNEETK